MTKAGTAAASVTRCILVCAAMMSVTIWSDETEPQAAQGAQHPQVDPITQYLRAIEQVEAEYSAYSTELGDLYLSLGKAQQQQGEFEDAKRSFQRGLQVERVNNGLTSLAQSAYLFSIADSENMLGNYDESQKAMEQLYNTYVANYDALSGEMLEPLNQILDWYMRTYKTRTPDDGYANLVVAERVAERIALVAERNNGLDSTETIKSYRKLGYLHYVISSHLREHGLPQKSSITISTGGAAPPSASQPATSHMHFERGKEAYEKIIESLEKRDDSTPQDKASAIAQLADWYLVFGQKRSATQAYKLAFEVVAESGETTVADALFGQPVPIRFALDEPPTVNENSVDLKMVVSSQGIPTDIQLLAPPAELDKNSQTEMIRSMRDKRFRPRLVNGEPADTPDFIFHYPLAALRSSSS